MVAVQLGRSALDYVVAALADADGLATSIRIDALNEPTVFVSKADDLAKLSDLNSGGIATQALADMELSSFVVSLKKKNFRLCSVLFHDPWSEVGDLDYAGPSPDEMVTIGGRICHLHDIASLTADLIGKYRARSVSFLRLIYVSELSVRGIMSLIEERPTDLFRTLARSVRHIAVSAYDDESWIAVRHDT